MALNENVFVPQIPYGTKDFLPKEAQRKRTIEQSLACLFSQWGYDEVITPACEYLENIVAGTGSEIESNLYKFFDHSNRLIALRPDMTTPIARLTATRLKEEGWPQKLFYLQNVFRYEQAQAGRQCEFYQGGVELIGSPGPAADAEVIALAVESLRRAGLENFKISLGQIEFINGIMEELNLSAAVQQAVKNYLVTRDLVGLATVADGIAGQAKIITAIPLLQGKDALVRAYELANNPQSKQALDNLAQIHALLVQYGLEDYVDFDLGIIRDFDYYTGVVFEGYTHGLGFPICGGGRYDKLLSVFGVDCPATGFALGVDRIMLALDRQGIALPVEPKDIYIGWQEGMLPEAISQAVILRNNGKCVEVALMPETMEKAQASQGKKGYGRLIYITG